MNYKPHGYAQVGRSIVHHVYASDVVVLDYAISALDTVKSLQKSGSVYTVPTGRKLVILCYNIAHKNSINTPVLSHGSVVDTEDVVLATPRLSGVHDFDELSIHVVATAGNYVTVDPNGVLIHWVQVIGYEVDI